jgi:hypothetical protein
MIRTSWTVMSKRSPENPGTITCDTGPANATPMTLVMPVSTISIPATAPARRPASSSSPSDRSLA